MNKIRTLNIRVSGKFDMSTCAYRVSYLIPLFFLFISCQKSDEPHQGPTIELCDENGFIGSSTIVAPGTLMSFNVVALEGTEKLTNFYIEIVGSDSNPVRFYDTAMYTEQLYWQKSFYKSSDPKEDWCFVVRDRRGGSTKTLITITADTNSAYTQLVEIVGINLGAQNSLQLGECFSFLYSQVYTIEDAFNNQEAIDMVYYFVEEDMNTIASPGANIDDGIFPDDLNPKYWEIRNTTRYIPLYISEEDFYESVNDSIIIANYVEDDAKRKAKVLVEGDIYAFKNQSNRYGMFMVKEVEGAETGSVLIDIKIQVQDE